MRIGFSIIMPNFNSLYLKRAIKSVINQTFDNWELILIDNFSKNFPDEFLNEINDKRINYFKFNNENNIAKSRNFGINKAKYNWIAFLDSDDVWINKKLEEVKKIIEKYDPDLIHHGMYYLPKKIGFIKKIIIDKSKPLKNPILNSLIEEGNGIANSSVVVKKNKLIDINFISEKKEKFSWEDYDCWLRLSLNNNKFFFINKVLGYIWVGRGRVSDNEQTYINCKNFMREYKNLIVSILGTKKKRPFWISNIYASYFFKKKNYLRSFYFLVIGGDKKIKTKIKYMILNFLIFYQSIFLKNLKEIKKKIKILFNRIILYEIKKINFDFSDEIKNENYEFIIINKYEEFQKYNNFFTSFNNKFFLKRFKKKNDKMLTLVDKKTNNIASYGWLSNKSPHFIEEVNKRFFFDFGSVLYDFNTLDGYRNKKLYKHLLNQINLNIALPLYIYSLSTNRFSINAILKAGFRKVKLINNFSNDFVQKFIK